MSTDLSQTPLNALTDLTGRTAVVTGGAAGIGRQIAVRFAQAGATVYLADIDQTAAKDAAKDIDRAIAVRLDATDADQHVEIARQVVEEQGSLDIWVNNAGIYPFDEVTDMDPDDWRTVLSLNLDGVFYGSRAAMAPMIEQGSGVIINMSSTAGYGAESGNIAHYTASKHGVRGFTKALALELGPKGVRAVALAPTLVETPGTLEQKEVISEAMGIDDAHEAFAEQIPLRRIGQPDDVARVALFAASDMASFVSGDTILIDGGLRAA